ncbi:hypothetical protein UFOVP873_3 [uncultured Caudovirales phage]|uniref:Phage tail tape measure protein n=1 Tax=uncultured Caudovirales phage TaxID=2100421 RepID=A0A6J5PC89_9CAUD|nr:hypothetical protein UFOVP873_3 [uncultured Caudovirales phage]
MAINIPIITEYVGAGVDKAIREFKQLETTGEKAQFAIKKAAVPAAAALVAVGAAAFDAVKGAMEDAAAQEQLARNIRGVTNASDSAIKKNEDFISSLSMATATADDELRPALAKLVTGTENLEEAQQGLRLAQDIAAGTGKDLATVSDALAKAYAGNDKGLKALDPRMKTLLKDGLDVEGAMSVLADTFGGDAAAAADTAEGRFKRLSIGLAETKESIGAALLPAIQAILPYIERFGKWAQDNTTTFLIVGGAIAGIATAILAVNFAMKAWTAATTAFTAVQAAFNAVMALNPIFLMVAAVVAVGAALVVLQMKFNIFGKALEAVGAVASALWNGMKAGFAGVVTVVSGYVNGLVAIYKGLFNGIASVWNNTVGKLSFKIPGWVPVIGGSGFDVPNIPMLADGGIVNGPTLAMIGERGPEAVVPLTGNNAPNLGNNITINVHGGDPNAIVDALRRYNRSNGPLPVRVA